MGNCYKKFFNANCDIIENIDSYTPPLLLDNVNENTLNNLSTHSDLSQSLKLSLKQADQLLETINT